MTVLSRFCSPDTGNVTAETVSASEFKERVITDCFAFAPDILRDGKAWAGKQLFVLEYKGLPPVLSVAEVLRRSSENSVKPFLIYETFAENTKFTPFNMVFALEKPTSDYKENISIHERLLSIFPECDKTMQKMFSFGKRSLFFDENAVLDSHAIRFAPGKSGEKSEIPEYICPEIDKRTGEIRRFHVDKGKLAEFVRKNYRFFFIADKLSGKNLAYWYESGVYTPVSENEIKSIIKDLIAKFDRSLVNMNEVNLVYKDILADRSRFKKRCDLNCDENIINFQNGILHFDTLELTPHSPDIISTVQIPCNWTKEAAETPYFTEYLRSLCDMDIGKARLIMQFMGVALSNIKGYRMKKSLFLVGKGNSGKSQFLSLLDNLLGEENICKVGIQQLEESRFILSSIMDKRVIGSSDMSFETAQSMENFKMLTGGDNIKVEVKNGGIYSAKFDGVIIMSGNSLPHFGGDKGSHVYDRMAIVRCDNVIPENERDGTLLEKMYAEREAIVHSAVLSARQVIQNGYKFDIPEECERNCALYRAENSPAIMFYSECCQKRPTEKPYSDNITTKRVHDVFREWYKRNYRSGETYVPSVRTFRKELAEYLETSVSEMESKCRGKLYYSFTLNDNTKDEFNYICGNFCAN